MTVCLFGAASKTIDKKYVEPVEKLGEYLARRGHDLVYGAGSTGEMGAACRGFQRGGGNVHGVVPSYFREELSEFVNWDCNKLTLTETMRERKFIMEDEADCFIIAPGGSGTFEEFFEVLTLKQLGRHRKPIAILNIDGYYNPLLETIETSIKAEFIKANCRYLYSAFDENSFEELAQYIENDDMRGMTIHDLK